MLIKDLAILCRESGGQKNKTPARRLIFKITFWRINMLLHRGWSRFPPGATSCPYTRTSLCRRMVRGIHKPTGLRIMAALFPGASPALDTRRLKNAPSGNLPHPTRCAAIFILLLVPPGGIGGVYPEIRGRKPEPPGEPDRRAEAIFATCAGFSMFTDYG